MLPCTEWPPPPCSSTLTLQFIDPDVLRELRITLKISKGPGGSAPRRIAVCRIFEQVSRLTDAWGATCMQLLLWGCLICTDSPSPQTPLPHQQVIAETAGQPGMFFPGTLAVKAGSNPVGRIWDKAEETAAQVSQRSRLTGWHAR